MNVFDDKALEWDKNQDNIERANVIAEEIMRRVKIKPAMNAFEFGCGTGLLSFNLTGLFKSITLADSCYFSQSHRKNSQILPNYLS